MNDKVNITEIAKQSTSIECFVVQVNFPLNLNSMAQNIPNVFTNNKSEQLSEEIDAKKIIYGTDGSMLFNKIGDEIKVLKLFSNLINAEIYENANKENALNLFLEQVENISRICNINNFIRVGVRKQYDYYFKDNEEKINTFKSIVPSQQNFIDIAIAKTILVGNYKAKVQYLPIIIDSKTGIRFDIDIYLDKTMSHSELKENLLNISNHFNDYISLLI